MWLVWSGLGFAAEPDAVALWERFQATRAAPGGPVACQTGLVRDLTTNWDAFDAAEQAEITRTIAPFKRSLVDPMPQVSPGGLTGPAGVDADGPKLFAGSDTCWGQQGANRILTDHYSIEWDGTSISESTARSFGDALERSWTKEFDDLGWLEPDGTSNYKIMAYVTNENYAGAYTTVSACGSVYMPYIVAGRGSFAAGSWFQDMAAHELNHASQFAYGFGHEFWFWEATATYLQDQVWPTHEEWAPYVTGYTQVPWVAMSASDQEDQTIFYHMYGMNIWLFYLDENVMGEDGARTQWEFSETHGRTYDLSQDEVLEDLGYDFRAAYVGFIAANTVMDYKQRRYMPEIDVADYITDVPSEGGASGTETPQQYGQHFLKVAMDEFDPDLPNLDLHFEGRLGGDWIALMVGTNDDAVTTVVDLQLEDDVGDGQLEDWDQYDEVWLVVSPTSSDTETWSYDWALSASAPPEPVDTAPPEDTDVNDEDVTGPKLFGCGCDQGGSGTGAAAAALAGLIVARRRRR